MLSGEATNTNLWFDKEECKVKKTTHCLILVSELKTYFLEIHNPLVVSRNNKTKRNLLKNSNIQNIDSLATPPPNNNISQNMNKRH